MHYAMQAYAQMLARPVSRHTQINLRWQLMNVFTWFIWETTVINRKVLYRILTLSDL